MPDVKMHIPMRISTIWLSGFLLLLTTAFATQTFAQDGPPTDAPPLVAPIDQDSILVSTPSIVLEWGLVDRAATYEVQLFFSELVAEQEPIPIKTKVLSDSTQELLVTDRLGFVNDAASDGDSTWHWRVRGRNANGGNPGGEGPWSDVWEFTLVEAENQPPNFTDVAAGDTTIFVLQLLEFGVVAVDPEGNNITYSLDAASAALGMTLDPNTGAFSWTPTEAQGPNMYPVTFTATDDGSPVASADTTITITVLVNGGWVSLPSDSAQIPEETLFETAVIAVDPAGATYTYSIDDAAIAAGMSITPDGAFSWTPTEAQGPGAFPVTFTATNDAAPPVSIDSTVTLIALEVNLAPTIEAIADDSVDVGETINITAVVSDPDIPENTLTVSLDQASLDAGMTIDNTTRTISWTPEALQVGMTFAVTVTVTDQGGLSDSATFNLVVPGGSVPPVSVVNTAPFCSAEDVFSLDWEPVAVDSYIVEFDTDPSFMSPDTLRLTTTTSDANAPLASLKQDDIYYWRVISVLGDQTSEPSQTLRFRRWPAQIQVATSLAFPKATESNDFRMISVPGASSIEIATTFAGQQAGNGPLFAGGDWDWSVWSDNTVETTYPGYVVNPTLGGEMFEPGRGMWAISTSAWTVPQTPVNAVTLVDNAFFAIPLNQSPQSMWTMIGNPFDFPVAWQDILDANPDITGDDELWDWTGQQYNAVTVLQPYVGYYFMNRDNRPQLNMPCYLEPAAGKVAAREQDHVASLQLSLHEDRNGMTPPLSNVAVNWNEGAEEGLDRHDRYVPPAHFESFRVSLVNENLETDYAYLSQETRPSLDDRQSFNLELKSIPGEVSYLRVAGLEDLANQEVYLFNEALGQSFNLHEDPVVLLEPDQEFSKLRLVIGDADYITSEESTLVPEGFKMQQSYPNPFVEQTTIEYALPDPEFVSIEIYNVLGQRVRTLVHGEQDAGYHRITWDGRSETGEDVASGMYLYVFKSPSQHATQRMVRVR